MYQHCSDLLVKSVSLLCKTKYTVFKRFFFFIPYQKISTGQFDASLHDFTMKIPEVHISNFFVDTTTHFKQNRHNISRFQGILCDVLKYNIKKVTCMLIYIIIENFHYLL